MSFGPGVPLGWRDIEAGHGKEKDLIPRVYLY